MYGDKHEELVSKAMSPTDGHALIYIIRAPGGKGRAWSLPFIFNREEIGKLWADQYLYVFSTPMNMLLQLADGSTHQLGIKENKTYYILYGFESSFLDAILDPFNWERSHFRVLDKTEGEKLVNSYRLTGNFKRVTIGQNIVKNVVPNIKFVNGNDVSYEYVYNSDLRTGSVTISGKDNLRENAINTIKNICEIKNVALTTKDITKYSHPRIITHDEKYSNNTLYIKFECVY